MQPDPARTWAVGAIANDHVLTRDRRWARLNYQAHNVAPWQAGDVVNDHAFTGAGWVPLPSGWRTDPTGRHQFRWWTGSSWGSRVRTRGLQFDDPLIPVAPAPPGSMSFYPRPAPAPAPARAPRRVVDVLDTVAWVL